MSQYIEGNTKGFVASAAIAKYARVTLAADGTVAASAIGEKDIGTAETVAFAAGDLVTVRLRNAQGTRICIAAGAIAVGAAVSTAAAGKVNDTAGTGSFVYGTALEAAAADGDYIEVLPNAHGDTAAS